MTITTPGPVADQVDHTPGTADWANAISLRTVRNYATLAELGLYETSPTIGQFATVADTRTLYQYVGPIMGWTLPWSMPWGLVTPTTGTNPAVVTTTQGSIVGTTADLTGLSVIWFATANRRYLIKGNIQCKSTVADDAAALWLTDISNTVLNVKASTFHSAGSEQPLSVELDMPSPGSGGYQVKLRLQRTGGSGTFTTTTLGATQPLQLMVYDTGPSGNPS